MYGFIITTAGEGLLARASAGEGLTLTEVWVGKGAVESAGAAKALTALLDPVAKATSTTPAVAGGQISMLVEYRNDMGGGLEEGFTLSEFGVMAKVGDDAPTLLYYAALGDRAQPVPPIAEGLDVHRFPVAIGVTGEVEVSLEYPAGVWVTHEELEEALAGIDLSGYIKATEKGKPGGVATLGEDSKVPAGQLPKMDYDPAGSAEAVQQALTVHTGDKNNPHGVTAEQVGASRAVKGTYPIAMGQSIQAGDVVDVVEGKAQKTLTPVANVETVLLERAVTHMAVCDLNSEYAVVADSQDNGSNHAAFLISKKTGKRVGDNNYANETTITGLSIARLSDTQFVVGYVYDNKPRMKVGTASGTSISFGEEFSSSSITDITDMALVSKSESEFYGIFGFRNQYWLTFWIFSVSGNVISAAHKKDSETGIKASNISATLIPDDFSGNKRVCICFSDENDGNKGKAVIATINGSNQVTWGEVVTFEDSRILVPDVCVSGSDAIVFFKTTYTTPDASNQHVCLLKVSNNVISLPNEKKTIWNRGSGNAENPISISQVGEKYVCLIPPGNSSYGSPAIVVSRNADALESGEAFQFCKSIAKALSACAISGNNLIVAYADAGNSSYGTVTTLTVSGNQIAGSFVDGSQDAIALQGGTEGQSIEVIYSGTVAADWVTEGQVISSPGVYGAGVLDGVLQVWSKDRPDNVVTGTYIGDGAPSQTIQLGFTPKAVLVCKNGILSRGYQSHYAEGLALDGYPAAESNSNVVSVVEGGFQVFDGTSANYNGRTNVASQKYYYLTWK